MSQLFRGLVAGTAVLTASRFVLKLFSALSNFLVLGQLSVHDYGIVTLALTISGPTLALSGLGLDDLMFAQSARARGENTLNRMMPVIGGFIMTKVTILLTLTVLLFVIKSLLGVKYQVLLDQYQWILLCWIWVVNLRTFQDGLLQSFENFKLYAKANIFESSIRTLAIVAFFIMHSLTIESLLWTYIGAKAIAGIVVLPVSIRLLRQTIAWKGMLRAYAQFIKLKGAWETARALAGNLFSGINQWMVGGLIGVEAVGYLSFASSLNSVAAQVSPFRQLLAPIMARLSSRGSSISFVARRMSKYAFWLASAVILISAVAVPIVTRFMFPHYLPALPLFFLLVFAQLLNAISVNHGALMYANNEQKYLFKLSLFGTLSSLSVLPALVRLLGVVGSIIENHLSTALIIWLRERRLRAKHELQTFVWKDLFVFDDFDKDSLRRAWLMIRTKAMSWRTV